MLFNHSTSQCRNQGGNSLVKNNNPARRAMKNFKHLFSTSVLILSVFLCGQAYALGCVNWAPETFVPATNAQGQKLPDYGLYWFKTDGSTVPQESVMKACDYADPKCRQQEQGYFDPKKPTLIFIHGWQPNTVKNKDRLDFCYQYQTSETTESPVYNTLAPWKDYNVAIFYWNQFADELTPVIGPEEGVVSAEAKIYSTNGSRGMEWKYLDNTGALHTCVAGDNTCVTPTKDIVDLAFDAYQTALPKFYHQEIRIAGQSLGAQVAIQLTAKIMQQPLLPQPGRLVLMDPFFAPDGKFTAQNQLPYSVAQYNSDTVTAILTMYHQRHPLSQLSFPIEVYRTSTVSFPPTGTPAWDLMSKVAYVRLYPDFIKGLSGTPLKAAEHMSSSYLYFYSKAITPKNNPADFNTFHIDAASSDADVSALMTYHRYQWVNVLDKSYARTWLSEFTNLEPLDPAKR